MFSCCFFSGAASVWLARENSYTSGFRDGAVARDFEVPGEAKRGHKGPQGAKIVGETA